MFDYLGSFPECELEPTFVLQPSANLSLAFRARGEFTAWQRCGTGYLPGNATLLAVKGETFVSVSHLRRPCGVTYAGAAEAFQTVRLLTDASELSGLTSSEPGRRRSAGESQPDPRRLN